MRIAAKVREEKEAHPERFCADPTCLWRTMSRITINGQPIQPVLLKPCPKHPTGAA